MTKKTKVLYVDDEVINLELFRINFRKIYHILTAIAPSEALKILDEHPETDVVISDMKMPELNGIEFIKRAKNKYPEIKYYILTGFEITPAITEALHTNLILKYFKKPYQMQEIEEAINSAMI